MGKGGKRNGAVFRGLRPEKLHPKKFPAPGAGLGVGEIHIDSPKYSFTQALSRFGRKTHPPAPFPWGRGERHGAVFRGLRPEKLHPKSSPPWGGVRGGGNPHR